MFFALFVMCGVIAFCAVLVRFLSWDDEREGWSAPAEPARPLLVAESAASGSPGGRAVLADEEILAGLLEKSGGRRCFQG